MIDHRDRILLLGQIVDQPLIVVIADNEIVDATVLFSPDEPDEEREWRPDRIHAIPGGEDREDML